MTMHPPDLDRRCVVVVADDNPGMRGLIRRLLAPMADIHECSNGADALALYRGLRPDGVLMDIRMAGVDGLAATRSILALDPAARVVIVTEVTDARTLELALAAGACECVSKEHLLELPSVVRNRFPTKSRAPSPQERMP